MGRRFAQIAFTPQVKHNQEAHGSWRQYQRLEDFVDHGNILNLHEKEFIAERDGFYMASVSESGWPTSSIEEARRASYASLMTTRLDS